MGVPTVTIVTDQFVTLARGTQKSQGLTDMCFVTVPHPIGMLPKEQVDAKVDAAFGDIVKAATQWQPVKEKEAAQESVSGQDLQVHRNLRRREQAVRQAQVVAFASHHPSHR